MIFLSKKQSQNVKINSDEFIVSPKSDVSWNDEVKSDEIWYVDWYENDLYENIKTRLNSQNKKIESISIEMKKYFKTW